MNLRLLIIPAVLFIGGGAAAIFGAFVIEPTIFWCGIAVAGIGVVLGSPESGQQ